MCAVVGVVGVQGVQALGVRVAAASGEHGEVGEDVVLSVAANPGSKTWGVSVIKNWMGIYMVEVEVEVEVV